MTAATARMPWFSSGSRVTAELESSSSSASLLHSIYGSQASRLFFADYSSEEVLSEMAPTSTTNLHTRTRHDRPKSSPVSVMATRMQRRFSSMQPEAGLQLTLQQTPLHNIELDTSSTETLETAAVYVGTRGRRPISASVTRLQGPISAPATRPRRPPSAPIARLQGPPSVPVARPRRPPSAPAVRSQRPPSASTARPRRPPSAPATGPPSASTHTQRRFNRPRTALGIRVRNYNTLCPI